MNTTGFVVRSSSQPGESAHKAITRTASPGGYSTFTRLSVKAETSEPAPAPAPAPRAKKARGGFAAAIAGIGGAFTAGSNAVMNGDRRAAKRAASVALPKTSKVIERDADREETCRPQRGRALALSGLCLLLVISGAWAAVTRNAANVVNLPINVTRTNKPTVQTPQATPEPAGAVNIEDIPMIEPSAATLGSFSTYKVEMDALRDKELRVLNELIADTKADAAMVQNALEQKLALTRSMDAEAVLQGLTAARGYGESYITVKTGSINVVVRNPNLTEAQMASLVEMVAIETGENAENVKIILTK